MSLLNPPGCLWARPHPVSKLREMCETLWWGTGEILLGRLEDSEDEDEEERWSRMITLCKCEAKNEQKSLDGQMARFSSDFSSNSHRFWRVICHGPPCQLLLRFNLRVATHPHHHLGTDSTPSLPHFICTHRKDLRTSSSSWNGFLYPADGGGGVSRKSGISANPRSLSCCQPGEPGRFCVPAVQADTLKVRAVTARPPPGPTHTRCVSTPAGKSRWQEKTGGEKHKAFFPLSYIYIYLYIFEILSKGSIFASAFAWLEQEARSSLARASQIGIFSAVFLHSRILFFTWNICGNSPSLPPITPFFSLQTKTSNILPWTVWKHMDTRRPAGSSNTSSVSPNCSRPVGGWEDGRDNWSRKSGPAKQTQIRKHSLCSALTWEKTWRWRILGEKIPTEE